MASYRAAGARRQRRLLAGAALAASLAFTALALGTTMSGHAADPGNGPGRPQKPSPTPSDVFPFPSPSPSDCNSDAQDCPAPSPSIYVVSPVPADPTPSPSTPSYLIGTIPTPTPSQTSADTVSSPVPLGGGFEDQLPSPSAAATTAPTSTLAPHDSGLPIPFLAVGAVLILAAAGSLIYALAPRATTPFTRPRTTAATSPIMFTPYGPDSGPTNILSGGQPGPRGSGS